MNTANPVPKESKTQLTGKNLERFHAEMVAAAGNYIDISSGVMNNSTITQQKADDEQFQINTADLQSLFNKDYVHNETDQI